MSWQTVAVGVFFTIGALYAFLHPRLQLLRDFNVMPSDSVTLAEQMIAYTFATILLIFGLAFIALGL